MPARSSIWKIGAIVGICLTVIGIVVGYLDFATPGGFERIVELVEPGPKNRPRTASNEHIDK
jgi:hypothetical protein